MGATATITVLMTDMVDSTALLRHGPEVAAALRREHVAAIRRALARHRGVEVKGTGDGVMATFLSARDAIAASVALQRGVDQLRQRDVRHPAVRVGVSTGEATLEDGDWYGSPVIEAARLVAGEQAAGGDVLTTGVVPLIVGRGAGYQFTSLGARALKGFDEPVDVVRVGWQPVAARPVPLPPAVRRAREGVYIGRDEEQTRLAEAWRRAAAGELQLALVSGEPGIGKTRLTAEVAALAHSQGALVLWGSCDEDLDIPFQPFAEGLRHWRSHDPDGFSVLAHPAVTALLPELGHQSIGSSSTSVDPGTDRLVLFNGVAALVAERARQGPLLLVLDDLHWAATPTLLLLRHVVSQAPDAAILVVGTYRDTELDRTGPLAETVARLGGSVDIERVVLGGMTSSEIRAYLEALGGEALSKRAEPVAGALRSHTAGNPFFVGEVVRHLLESDTLARIGGRSRPTTDVGDLGVREGVREVVGRRLSRLPTGADNALAVAAVIGHEFEGRQVEGLLPITDRRHCLDWLDAAVGARLIEEVAGWPGRYTFVHAIVRHTLLAELTAARRASLHRGVAEVMSSADDGDPVSVAYHACAGATAGSITEAVTWSLRAAEKLSEAFAFEQAVGVLERAIEVLELSGTNDLSSRARLRLGLAHAAQSIGDTARAKQVAVLAASDAREAHDIRILASAAKVRVEWGLAGVPDPEGRALVEEALVAVGDDDLALRAGLVSDLAFYRALNESEGVRADPLAREAIGLARQAGDPETLVHTLENFVLTHVGLPDIDEQEKLLAEYQAVSALVSQDVGLYYLMTGFRANVVLRLQRGDVSGSRAAAADGARMASLFTDGDRANQVNSVGPDDVDEWPRIPPFGCMWSAMHALAEGRIDDAEAANATLGQVARDPNFMNSWAAQLFRIRRDQGRVGELVPAVREMIEQTPGLVAAQSVLALALTDLDDLDGARHLFNRLVADELSRVPRDTTWSTSLADLTEVAAALDDRQAAKLLRGQLQAFAGQMLVISWGVACLGAADAYLGLLNKVLGQYAEADEQFGRAVALEAIAAPALVPRTERWRAN